MIQNFLRQSERPSAPISSSSIAGEPGLAIDDTLACITHSTHTATDMDITSHFRLQTIKVDSVLNNDPKKRTSDTNSQSFVNDALSWLRMTSAPSLFLEHFISRSNVQ